MSSVRQSIPFERREYFRGPATGAAVCRSPRFLGGVVPATPINISQNGVLLLLGHSVEGRDELDIELTKRGFTIAARVIVRTVAAREFSRWQAGCQFVVPLTAEQLSRFQS